MITENVSGAGNQQRRFRLRLSWLGGIIDGEGMITAVRRKSRTRKQYGYAPRISIVNTDMAIIDEAISIFEELSLPYYLQTKPGKGTWKVKYEVIFNGIKKCQPVLKVVIPYLIAKRSKAVMLLKFCDHRLRLAQNSPYSLADIELAESVRVRRETLRDYTPRTAEKAAKI